MGCGTDLIVFVRQREGREVRRIDGQRERLSGVVDGVGWEDE